MVNQEKRKRERVKTAQKFVVEMGIVAALGVTAGILFAPKSGRETRVYIMKKAVNTAATIKDTVKYTAEGVKEDIKDGYHEITKDKTGDNILNKSIDL